MSDIRVAARYAKSLIELSVERDVLEAVRKDMTLFASVCRENRDFALMLKSPVIKSDKKLNIIKAVFGDRRSELTLAFLEISSRKGREQVLPAIATAFVEQYNQFKGIGKVTVTTTFALTDELRKEFVALAKKLNHKDVILEERVDESLIGGYILKMGDRQIDESIKRQINELKREFSNEAYVRTI